MQKISSDLFELLEYIEKIPDGKPILLIDAILNQNLPTSSIIVFDLKEQSISDTKFATLRHSLSVIDLLKMNQIITKRNLSIIFLGIVIENTEFGEIINGQILNKIPVILDIITNFCQNNEILGKYD